MRNTYIAFVLVLLLIPVLFLTGCGGGSGGSTNSPEAETPNTQSEPNDNPNLEQEYSAHYDPYHFTEEQLISLAHSAVPKSSFDVSLLEEDDDDEFIGNASYNPYILRTADITEEQQAKSAKRIVSNMWKHAVKLAAFPDSVDVPYRQEGRTIRLNQTTTSHGSKAETTMQKRFLYVYPSYENPPALETFPYKQYLSGGCEHEIMGTDCVGFIYHCVYAATKNYDAMSANKPVKGARMRFGPYPPEKDSSIVNKENWIGTGLFPNAKLIADKSQPPKPGDILVWDGHVGMAVRIDRNTIGVAHSTGNSLYTCAEYASYADEDVAWVGYPSQRSYSGENGVNGFVVHRYDDYTRSGGPGMGRQEKYRLRAEETEISDEYDDPVIAKLTGTWKPVDAKCYYNYTNDYGVFYHQRIDSFVKYNPNDPEYSSSLVFNVTAGTQIADTAYQSVKEYVISSDGHIVVASYTDGVRYERLEYIFHPDNALLNFRLSGDILVCDTYTNTYNTNTTKIYFIGSSKIRIESLLKNVFRADSEEWVIELERADGTEAPEPDEWLAKLSGDWEPVDYTCLIQDGDNSYYYDKMIPYDAIGERYDAYDGSRRSSQTITITPRKEFYWYRFAHDGHVAAEHGDTESSYWDIVGHNNFLLNLPLEVSGDVLVGYAEFVESDTQQPNEFYREEVNFSDNNLVFINDEREAHYGDDYNYYIRHQVTLRRKK